LNVLLYIRVHVQVVLSSGRLGWGKVHVIPHHEATGELVSKAVLPRPEEAFDTVQQAKQNMSLDDVIYSHMMLLVCKLFS
jgi:microcompartment protein CcmL/EutN